MSAPPSVTPDAIAAAEKILGLHFDNAAREQLVRSIERLGRVRDRIRELPLENSLPPALRFDPLLPGMELPVGPSELGRSPLRAPTPSADDDIAYAPLGQLAQWIERRELSSTRLTELYLERLARFGPGLECVITLCEERSRSEAARADAELAAGRYRGPLHGIPWGAKDLLDTAGIATTWGTAPYRDRIPERDAVVVERLAAAGAVLLAKLSLGELAYGDVWFGGKTRNPWQPEQGSGGSSAGSAAATAAGLCGFAIGSETLGSIANPSAVCGTVGLRPTHGRVPRTGAMALCWTLDKLGPIARKVEDTVLVLAAIAGRDPGDPDAVDVRLSFDASGGAQGRSVGYVPQQFEADGVSDEERDALVLLRESGAKLVEIDTPALPRLVPLLLVWVEAAAAFQELLLAGRLGELKRQDDEAWPNQFRLAHLVSAVDYVNALRVRRRIMEEMRERFERVDAIVAPNMGDAFTFFTNASGHPALTLPLQLGIEPPRAVTLFGHLYDEGRLCEIARALERALGPRARPAGF